MSSLPTGSGIGNLLRKPLIPAIIIQARPRCGFAVPSNVVISKLVTISAAPGGQQARTINSLHSIPQQR